MVLLYHQPAHGIIEGIFFYPGFMGVDIFFFFSGLGLCYSINKNSISNFYKHRLIRIAPLYIVLGLLVSVYNNENTIWGYFCNITSLSYYGIGGRMFEWYLSSLFVFYLLFPFLYRFITRLYSSKVWQVLLPTLWAFILTLFTLCDIPWWFETAIGRVQIFVLGMLCYYNKMNFNVGLWVFSFALLPTLILYMQGLISTYILLYCLSPALIMGLSYLIPWLEKSRRLNRMFVFWGKKSLEIYVANCIVMKFMGHGFSGVEATAIYWIAITLVIPPICWLNNYISNQFVYRRS